MTLTFNKTYALLTAVLLLIEIGIALGFKTGFIRYTLGDYLAVILLYCFFKSFLKSSPVKLAVIALIIAFSIEFGQYFNILETLGLQHNPWAALLLGSHFSISDLMAYTLGMSTFLLIDVTRLNYE